MEIYAVVYIRSCSTVSIPLALCRGRRLTRRFAGAVKHTHTQEMYALMHKVTGQP